MRRLGALALCVLALAGCSGSHHSPRTSPSAEAGAAALARWNVAVARFQSEMHQCLGRMSPIRGFWTACMSAEHRRYERATASTLAALRAVPGGSPACSQSKSVATSVVAQLESAWTRAWLADGRALRGIRSNPAAATLDDRADNETGTNTRLVPRLAAAMRRSCV
jgi:hypothetical protein